ncbi:hypothetical protein MKK75_32080 [Methylobacterium sp. J-030]|uniref:hypothetical protein n=1 Tax=Methylobacterium sp. J-030 TaxID=2836627 RepID=UPI001FB93DA8|nr:hypothetical protein [Methylobacterium sp. J-030]MCJ2073373.1 hypothetical protein [Methylobacterium sp. J-030]
MVHLTLTASALTVWAETATFACAMDISLQATVALPVGQSLQLVAPSDLFEKALCDEKRWRETALQRGGTSSARVEFERDRDLSQPSSAEGTLVPELWRITCGVLQAVWPIRSTLAQASPPPVHPASADPILAPNLRDALRLLHDFADLKLGEQTDAIRVGPERCEAGAGGVFRVVQGLDLPQLEMALLRDDARDMTRFLRGMRAARTWSENGRQVFADGQRWCRVKTVERARQGGRLLAIPWAVTVTVQAPDLQKALNVLRVQFIEPDGHVRVSWSAAEPNCLLFTVGVTSGEAVFRCPVKPAATDAPSNAPPDGPSAAAYELTVLYSDLRRASPVVANRSVEIGLGTKGLRVSQHAEPAHLHTFVAAQR